MKTQQHIKALNDLLRRELAAAAACEKTEVRIAGSEWVELEQNRQAHVASAVALAQDIRRHGGQPAPTAGAWRLASSIVGGSASVSDRLAIKALHEGEMVLTDSLMRSLNDLPYEDRRLIRRDLLPAQRESEARAESVSNEGTA